MRNEEPTRTDLPPRFAGGLAADLGASLGWRWAHPERRLEDPVEDRSGARREQELAAALSRESELAEGFADARFVSRRLDGRPC